MLYTYSPRCHLWHLSSNLYKIHRLCLHDLCGLWLPMWLLALWYDGRKNTGRTQHYAHLNGRLKWKFCWYFLRYWNIFLIRDAWLKKLTECWITVPKRIETNNRAHAPVQHPKVLSPVSCSWCRCWNIPPNGKVVDFHRCPYCSI